MKALIVGNWKMNKHIADAEALVQALKTGLESQAAVLDHCEVGVCPPALALASVAKVLSGTAVAVGGQNCHQEDSGAFTGEVSASMLKDAGAGFVLVGHSERRQYYKESNELLSAKLRAALEVGLQVIFCVGESLKEREANDQEAVVGGQVRAVLTGLTDEQMASVRVAYEPVWAIGTGRTASPEQAGAMHVFIRGVLTELFGQERAQSTPILYGGSVKPANAVALLGTEGIDGALVGGASLKAQDFLSIIAASQN